MAGKLESIEIFPGENGGHRVVHNFKREAGKKQGAMGGGVYMERPKPGEHFFGNSEDAMVLAHGLPQALPEPKPLDAGNYISESAERAANQNLPTIDSTGNIHF